MSTYTYTWDTSGEGGCDRWYSETGKLVFNTKDQTVFTSEYYNLSSYGDDGNGTTTESVGKYTLETKGKDSCLTIFLPNIETKITIEGGNGTVQDFEKLKEFSCGKFYSK
jgi:hypothetical protein